MNFGGSGGFCRRAEDRFRSPAMRSSAVGSQPPPRQYRPVALRRPPRRQLSSANRVPRCRRSAHSGRRSPQHAAVTGYPHGAAAGGGALGPTGGAGRGARDAQASGLPQHHLTFAGVQCSAKTLPPCGRACTDPVPPPQLPRYYVIRRYGGQPQLRLSVNGVARPTGAAPGQRWRARRPRSRSPPSRQPHKSHRLTPSYIARAGLSQRQREERGRQKQKHPRIASPGLLTVCRPIAPDPTRNPRYADHK